MNNVYWIIKEISKTSSTKEKEKILLKNCTNSKLKQYLDFVYNKAKYTFTFRRDLKKFISGDFPNKEQITFSQIEKLANDLNDRHYTGIEGISYISNIASKLDEYSLELLQWMFDRDVHAGISVSTINKVWSDLIKKLPYMRCSSFKKKAFTEKDWEVGVFSQEKMDGEFANVEKSNGDYSILSRQYSEYKITSDFDNIISEMNKIYLDNVNYTGEFIVFEDGIALPREKSNGIMNSLLNGGRLESNQEIHYFIWDYVPLEYFKPKGKYEVPYVKRFEILNDINNFKYVHLVENKIVHSWKEAKEHFKFIVNVKRGEGTVLKKSNAIWRDGTSTEIFKLKPVAQCELKVVDVNWDGTGKNSDLFKSLICQSEDGLIEVDVSGFKDDKRKYIFQNMDKYIGSIISVKFNAITKARKSETYALTHPRFDGEVYHKNVANTYKEIVEIFEAVLESGEF